ncbi:hypothetical protein WHZ78_08910 [Bradyrhizobium symbiodeficiens]|uniref:hypothetical protein n=1 Tax=Bradyrhizobium symbiodeficiens TaxID=1404367 RepID=UPI0030D5FC4B
MIATCFVGFNGKPVASVKKGSRRPWGLPACRVKSTPHVLRHTAATWLMQRGVPIWEAAGFLGMFPEVVQDTYGTITPAACRARHLPSDKRAAMFRGPKRWSA